MVRECLALDEINAIFGMVEWIMKRFANGLSSCCRFLRVFVVILGAVQIIILLMQLKSLILPRP